ncbi:hypothetical protein [Nocardia paucivorans]|uniref:hypothetical protein n=1 Tax=Nocardia paucivorans TaxID=114259 RepID=UPI00031BD17F|nr:hypothetical protein [Nocardia paucivorans]
MSEQSEQHVRFDPDAAAMYTAASARIAELLDTAAGHSETAAEVDLSAGLGVLGADFAAAFAAAMATQARTVRLALGLVNGYAATVAAAGAALADTDAQTATALNTAAAEVL